MTSVSCYLAIVGLIACADFLQLTTILTHIKLMSPSLHSHHRRHLSQSQCSPPPFPWLTQPHPNSTENKRATCSTQNLDGIPLWHEYVAIPVPTLIHQLNTQTAQFRALQVSFASWPFTRRILMFLPSFPAIFQKFSAVCVSFTTFGMSISPVNALVWFPMSFGLFSASLASSIGRSDGFIFFQSILMICGTFTVVFMLISTLAVIVKLSSRTCTPACIAPNPCMYYGWQDNNNTTTAMTHITEQWHWPPSTIHPLTLTHAPMHHSLYQLVGV